MIISKVSSDTFIADCADYEVLDILGALPPGIYQVEDTGILYKVKNGKVLQL